MESQKQAPIVKVIGDTIDRKTGLQLFAGMLVALMVLFFLAGAIVPPVFRQLKANSDCIYNGHHLDKLTTYCEKFHVNTQNTWEALITNMNATNTFLSITGQVTRTNLRLEDGELNRTIH